MTHAHGRARKDIPFVIDRCNVISLILSIERVLRAPLVPARFSGKNSGVRASGQRPWLWQPDGRQGGDGAGGAVLSLCVGDTPRPEIVIFEESAIDGPCSAVRGKSRRSVGAADWTVYAALLRESRQQAAIHSGIEANAFGNAKC
jgi:hypothetical protein